MKRIVVIVLAVALTVSLLLPSASFAAGGGNEGVPAQTVLDASLSEVSTVFDIPSEDLEVAASRVFTFGDDRFLLSSIVDKGSKQAYMVSTDGEGKVWIAEPKIEDELIDYLAQLKSDETIVVSIWAIYVSPEEELWQIPSKYADVPFQGYRPALGANVSPEVLDAIEADMAEIKLRANKVAVQPVVDFLQSVGAEIVYVSLLAPVVDVELGKDGVYGLARVPEVKNICMPDGAELGLDAAAQTIIADEVWDEGYDGGGTDGMFGQSKYYPYQYQTHVAVIDSGIHFTHPSLDHADGGTYEDMTPQLDHGTQVAGCIASAHDLFKGVAYGTQLLDANYFFAWPPSDWSRVKIVSEWAYENYVDLYSLSSGWITNGQWNNDYCRYYDHIAYEWHRLPVCCAHNDGRTSGWVRSPGNAFNVLTVGGIDDDNTPNWNDDEIADFSSWRNPIDGREKPEVCAPAVDITTTTPGEFEGDPAFTTVSGTSFATPQVTGIAAQLIEQDQSLVYWPELTKAIIMASAIHNVVPNTIEYDEDPDVVYHPSFYPVDKFEGVGTVDAYAAYQCVNEGDYICTWRPNDDPFYIAQFQVNAGQKVRFAINWLAHTDYNGSGDYGLCADFNLRVCSPITVISYYSVSDTNPWEIVEFTAPLTGTYKARVTVPRFESDYEWVAAASYIW
jgi:hypothetical protein